MSEDSKGYLSTASKKVTTHRLREMKQLGDKIAMLTAYDYSMANVIDQAGVDAILVGDSASNVMVGNRTTLPMTVDQMIYHGKSVMNGVKRALVVIDMPFGSYHASPRRLLPMLQRSCGKRKLMPLNWKGEEIIDAVKAILSAGFLSWAIWD